MTAKIITVTLWRRPEYTRRLFDALAQCYGIGEYEVIIHQAWTTEHTEKCLAVQEIVKQFCDRRVCATEYMMEVPRLGGMSSKLAIMAKAFHLTDFAINFEDDTIPDGRDTLRFFEWVNRTYAHDPTVLCASGWSKGAPDPDHRYRVSPTRHFNFWGYGIWADRWEWLFGRDAVDCRNWNINLVFEDRGDWWVEEWLRRHPDCRGTLFPWVARCQNIGRHEGMHTNAETFANDGNPDGIWSLPDPGDPGDRPWEVLT